MTSVVVGVLLDAQTPRDSKSVAAISMIAASVLVPPTSTPMRYGPLVLVMVGMRWSWCHGGATAPVRKIEGNMSLNSEMGLCSYMYLADVLLIPLPSTQVPLQPKTIECSKGHYSGNESGLSPMCNRPQWNISPRNLGTTLNHAYSGMHSRATCGEGVAYRRVRRSVAQSTNGTPDIPDVEMSLLLPVASVS